MTGAEIRRSFLDFFHARGHEIVPRSSLVPENDPTLLFTNAGMVPFKRVFLGQERRTNPRAVDSQVCLRLSGKHNDLEEVGRDTYHHTLFEMLGNWSFGDYQKRDAIVWAWELLTRRWGLPADRLWVTVHHTDDEAEALWWRETNVVRDHVLRFGDRDNFWEMGETGPCGPCSEIHIDRGPAACDRQSAPEHRCGVNAGCARYIELWNLVFIQFNRLPDQSLQELEAKHVDTGMGLERVTAVLQDVPSNYDTDLFQGIIDFTAASAGRSYGKNAADDLALRVVADHSRALSFLIADGVLPANDGRGYVLRRILRRAARHAHHLGFREPFLWRATEAVIQTMGEAYPELRAHRSRIESTIRAEEERFGETLVKGLALLEDERSRLGGAGERVLPGDVAFRLYDTFGFPLDMTQDILRSEGIAVDTDGFDRAMAEQKQRAREARRAVGPTIVHGTETARFLGDRAVSTESDIIALYDGAESVAELRDGDEGQIVTAETPFYGESGGQVGDRGEIVAEDGSTFRVEDTQKPRPDLTVHIGEVVRGVFKRGQQVTLRIDTSWRERARLNHSATHILHAVLRERLGEHVRQAGSLVTPQRLRFDFSHSGPIEADALQEIEDRANAYIRENAEVVATEMAYDDAIRAGALAFFGDKYGDRVRVIRMGQFSVELCGGTHVRRTGDIGLLKVLGEGGVAAGTRRVEATTGSDALATVHEREQTLRRLGELVKGSESEVAEKVERLLAQQREYERQLDQLQRKLAGSESESLLAKQVTVGDVRLVAAEIPGADAKRLREIADQLRPKLGSGVVVLASGDGDRVNILAAVTPDLAGRVHAGKLVGQLAPIVGGKGGGRPDFAQAGGKDPSRIGEALARVAVILS